jgi:hypothetical protein
MALLAGKAYDPATAVSKATTAALAMTALDTTNLRHTFTVPASGSVLVRLQGTLHGGTATPFVPQVLLGVLEGATVRGRLAPAGLPNGTVGSATLYVTVEALFLVTGLTAGASLTWDAAYGVEGIVAGSALKYGGPNGTTVNDAFGAFIFELYSV